MIPNTIVSLLIVAIAMVIIVLGSTSSGEKTPPASSPATDTTPPACCRLDGNEKESQSTHDSDSSKTSVDTTHETPLPEPFDSNSPKLARVSEWLQPDQRLAFDLDYRMTDQDGVDLTLTDLADTPLAISFIFTRCPNPEMCPLITTTMAHLQDKLNQVGLDDKIKLLLITYDPTYDTPQRLKAYGMDRGLSFTNAKMLRPNPDEFYNLLHEFQMGVNYNSDGSIGHFIELILVDRQGRFVRDYQGHLWDNTAVVDDLSRLVAEQDQPDNGR